MVMRLIEMIKEFVANNAPIIAITVAAVEYVKRVAVWDWVKSWHITLAAFIISYIVVIPPTGFAGIDWLEFAVNGFAAGLVATGFYKTAESLINKT